MACHQINKITVKDYGASLINKGYLTIYSKWIMKNGNITRGSPVILVDTKGTILGYGFYENLGAVGVRLLGTSTDFSCDPCEWIQENIEKALRRRNRIVYWGNAYRLINADGDKLPGIIIDVYNDIAVLQSTSYYGDKMLECIGRYLFEKHGFYFYVKNTQLSRKELGMKIWSRGVPGIPSKTKTIIREGDAVFEVDVEKGQKTGFYLDQAINRIELSKYIKGGENILDLYSYTGGFTVHLLIKGAEHSILVDESTYAVEQAAKNMYLNKISSQATIINTRVENFLNNMMVDKRRFFDIVIIDPPNLAPRKEYREKALIVYRKILRKTMRLIRDQGIVALFSCSYYIHGDDLLNIAFEEGLRARRILGILGGVLSASPDHIIRAKDYELSYLKGYILLVE